MHHLCCSPVCSIIDHFSTSLLKDWISEKFRLDEKRQMKWLTQELLLVVTLPDFTWLFRCWLKENYVSDSVVLMMSWNSELWSQIDYLFQKETTIHHWQLFWHNTKREFPSRVWSFAWENNPWGQKPFWCALRWRCHCWGKSLCYLRSHLAPFPQPYTIEAISVITICYCIFLLLTNR